MQPRDSTTPEAVARVPSETGDEGAIPPDSTTPGNPAGHPGNPPGPKPTPHTDDKADNESAPPSKEAGESQPDTSLPTASEKRKTARNTGPEPFEKWERDEMEKLLGQLNGHLGLWRHISSNPDNADPTTHSAILEPVPGRGRCGQ
jgi:phospholipase D1/2